VVQRTRTRWEGPRKTQDQSNRRIAEISRRVEPLNARFAAFLAYYSKEEMVVITVGLAHIETECFRLWPNVLYQEGPQITLNGREAPELTNALLQNSDLRVAVGVVVGMSPAIG
jgi:hypothetical protein